MGIHFAAFSELAQRLPGVESSTSYGTPALKVRGKLLARLWEDGETVVLRMDWESRERLLAYAPDCYFLTDHYRDYGYVLVRLGQLSPDEALTQLNHAWRLLASKRMLADYDAASRISSA